MLEYGASGDCRDGGVVCGPDALDGNDHENGAYTPQAMSVADYPRGGTGQGTYE